MKFYILFFLFITTIAFSQEKIKHTVAKGETIYGIAKKYDINEADLIELNPKLKNAPLQLNSVLWIPNKNPKSGVNSESKETANQTILHEVQPKETLYAISRKYQTTVEKIKEANLSLKGNEIKEGSQIVIPVSKDVFVSRPNIETKTVAVSPKITKNKETVSQNSDEEITHTVVARETKYGISKQYSISIAELEKLNPKIIKGLDIGDKLTIREGKTKETSVVDNSPKVVSKKEQIIQNKTPETPSIPTDASSKADILIAKASENIGVPYRSGGTDKDGFDCSGLIFYTFKTIDMNLPRTSSDMAANAGFKIDKSNAQKGDLIFFDTMNRGDVSHVGMITEVLEDEIKFIHASTSMGVMISSTKEDYFSQRLVQINRVLEN